MARPRKFRKYSPVEIEQLIQRSDNALYNALTALYQCQLDDEQSVERSIYFNRRGFAKPDAKMLTVLAKLLQSDGLLSFENKERLRTKLVRRYVKQITKICNYNWDTQQVTLI